MTIPLSAELRELVERQSGILTARQVLAAGYTRNAIAWKVSQGHWQRMYRGVYASFSGQPGRQSLLWAAVLSAGPGAMLSYQTAAEQAGLTDEPSSLIHISVPADRRISRVTGIVIHLSARASDTLHPAKLPPQTRVEETLLDLANAAATVDEACHWLLRGIQRRKTTQEKLRLAIQQRPKMRWRSELWELLSADAAGLHSILEIRYYRDVEKPHGLPRADRQAAVKRSGRNEYRDVLYEQYLTAVELDGRLAHPAETHWQDMRRDNAAAADGVTTLRYSWIQVTKHPCAVAAEVAQVLARRGFIAARRCSSTCPVARVDQADATTGTPERPTTVKLPMLTARGRQGPARPDRRVSAVDRNYSPKPSAPRLRRIAPGLGSPTVTLRSRVSPP